MKETCLSLLFAYLLVFSIAAQVPIVPVASSGLVNQSPESSLISETIPFKKEIQEIHSLQKAYDSLNQDIQKFKTSKLDSTQRDSLVNALKSRSLGIIEQEKTMLLSLSSEASPSSQKLKHSGTYLLSQLEKSKTAMKQAQEMVTIEEIIEQNEENLKAIFNEQLMPELKQNLGGTINKQLISPDTGIKDYYGKGALKELAREKISPGLTLTKAQSLVKDNAKSISNEYLQNIGNNYSKISIDSLGNIQVAEAKRTVKAFSLKETNRLKNAPFTDRTGLYLWYDPLTSFAEGIFVDLGIRYSISSQWHSFGGINIKRQFKNQIGPTSTGDGIKGGLRFSLGNWLLQGELARSRIILAHEPVFESKNFDGTIWLSGLGVGRTISMGKKLQSVVLLTWDPLFKESRSLSTSRFQLRIGFELKQLKIITEEVPKKQISTNPRPSVTSNILD